jgi:hypothetical protein
VKGGRIEAAKLRRWEAMKLGIRNVEFGRRRKKTEQGGRIEGGKIRR